MVKLSMSPLPSRRAIMPITPTLVIGVGKYGKQVGIQLAARLRLTEDGLRLEGLKRSLLVHTDGKPMPGLVRIMELNWESWMNNGYSPDLFLTDIDLPAPSVAAKGTPPQSREEDMPIADRDAALLALPNMTGRLFSVSEPLRIHDTSNTSG